MPEYKKYLYPDKFLIKSLYRQPHNIIITSRNILHSDKANPLLHSIGAGFIHRLELIYIISDFLFAQFGKRTSVWAAKLRCHSVVVIQTPVNTS